MTLTEHEITSQHDALKKTVACLSSRKNDIEAFFGRHRTNKFVFLGCGSSYLLSKGFAAMFSRAEGIRASALSGGDLLLAPEMYDEVLRGCVLVAISRSGETTEVIRAVSVMRGRVDFSVFLLVMKEGSALESLSDFAVVMPWAYDESVCQTRCITNLYAAGLLLYGYRFSDGRLQSQVEAAAETNEAFRQKHRALLEEAAGWGFDSVVVLADEGLCGIAEEAALAFTEIAMIPGSYHHTLDYRHGPIVLNGARTLNFVAMQPSESVYQKDLIADIKKRGGRVISFGKADGVSSDIHIPQDGLEAYEAYGIPFIGICQMVALATALNKGINPDKPSGLDAFVRLS